MPEIVIIPVHGLVCGQLTSSEDLQIDPIDHISKQSGQSYYFHFASSRVCSSPLICMLPLRSSPMDKRRIPMPGI